MNILVNSNIQIMGGNENIAQTGHDALVYAGGAFPRLAGESA